MSNKGNKSSKAAARNAANTTSALAEPEVLLDTTVAGASNTSKSRPSNRMYNRYVIGLGTMVLILFVSRISITPGHSSQAKDETISVGESNVAAVYREDPFETRVPVDSIVEILRHISYFFDRTLNPELSLVGWVFNREASKLGKSLAEISTKMKQDWTGSIVKSEMTEKTGAVLDALLSTIDLESMAKLDYSHNVNISPRALAKELKLLIEIISGTLTGNHSSGPQTPSMRTANYIDYMNFKVDGVLLPDIIKEYVVLFEQIGLEKILIGLKEILLEWRKQFNPES